MNLSGIGVTSCLAVLMTCAVHCSHIVGSIMLPPAKRPRGRPSPGAAIAIRILQEEGLVDDEPAQRLRRGVHVPEEGPAPPPNLEYAPPVFELEFALVQGPLTTHLRIFMLLRKALDERSPNHILSWMQPYATC